MRAKRRHMKINGLPVKDGKSSIDLVVTTGDVKRSTAKDPTNCVAARACRRALGASEARVHVGRTYIRFNGHWERYHTSPALRAEIVSFDRGGKFEPGTYRLIKIQPSQGKDRRWGKRTNKGKKRGKYHVLTNVRPVGIYA